MPLLESVKSIIKAGIYWLIENASCMCCKMVLLCSYNNIKRARTVCSIVRRENNRF